MAPTFTAVFGPSGLLDPDWLDSSGFPLSDDCLHHLVITNGSPPTASKACQLNGYWMTRTTTDKTVGGYYKEPVEQKRLLEATAASLLGPHLGNRLSLLQLAPIGAILLVLTSYTSVCRSPQPVMTV